MKIAPHFINEIASKTEGRIAQYTNNGFVQFLVFDTRSLFVGESALFIAIKTNKRNGHDFIPEAYAKGIRNFLVDQDIVFNESDVNVIRVDNVMLALHKWAAKHRKTITAPVVAITGSNGKTTLKEWLNILLSDLFTISRSPKSFNSQLGVPLSVLQVEKVHKLALIEVGISMPGEMEPIAQWLKPDITILTNVEKAHAVNFRDKTQHVAEKLKLAEHSSVLVYSSNDPEIQSQALKLKVRKLSWGTHADDMQFQLKGKLLQLHYDKKMTEFNLNFDDPGSIQNCCHAIACTYALGIDPVLIIQNFEQIDPVEMRFELKDAINNCKIINDTYSLDFHSFQLAVEYVARNAGELSKTVILSDFPELNLGKREFYGNVAAVLNDAGVNKFIGIGSDIAIALNLFNGQSVHYSTMEDFLEHNKSFDYNNELILIKGSRTSKFEKLVSFFDLKVHSTYLKVDLSAIQHNLNYYQTLVKPGTKIMVMVKALAYGSGSREISHLLEFNRVDYLAVAYADEGIELRKSGIRLPVMVMNPDKSTFGLLHKYNLEPEVYNFTQLSHLAEFLTAKGISACKIHIKVDTGMNRLGFKTNELEQLILLLRSCKSIIVQSVFTHLSSADVPSEREFTLKQIQAFSQFANQLCSALAIQPLRHILNSPGIENFPEHANDMVRLGIGLHGIGTNQEINSRLQPVHSLITHISHINHLQAGDTVGYSRKGKVNSSKMIAVVPIGYADGYFRSFGNGRGKMLVNGILAPVIGNVCMDMTMLDITDIPQTQIGDRVVVFGESLPVTQVASWADTIPYELLTSVSTRVKRVYIDHV